MKITEKTTKTGLKVYRPMLRVSRIFYSRAEAIEWMRAGQEALKAAYYSGPPVPKVSPTGHRQTGPHGTRLRPELRNEVATKNNACATSRAALGCD